MSPVRANVWLTTGFVAVTGAAAWGFTPWQRSLVTVVDLALFGLGIAAFAWAFGLAVVRSRTQDISVGGLFLLSGGIVSRRDAMVMHGCLAVQSLTGVAGAMVRASTDGRPGSVLAFGVLVPMLGVGLNGVVAMSRGSFGSRRTSEDDDEPPIGKNGAHG